MLQNRRRDCESPRTGCKCYIECGERLEEGLGNTKRVGLTHIAGGGYNIRAEGTKARADIAKSAQKAAEVRTDVAKSTQKAAEAGADVAKACADVVESAQRLWMPALTMRKPRRLEAGVSNTKCVVLANIARGCCEVPRRGCNIPR